MDKSLPRSIVARKLWWNYHFYSPCHKHLENKFLESMIEFHKDRQKAGWDAKYKKHKLMFKIWFTIKLQISNDSMQEYLFSVYNEGRYSKHLERKLEQSLGIFGKK